MHQRFLFLFLILSLALCSGCSRLRQDAAATKPSPQTMKTVGQWNVLANQVANRINTELIRQNYLQATVYVRHTCGKTASCGPGDTFPFDVGFNELLTTQLVNFGVNIVRTPEQAHLLVEYAVETNSSSRQDKGQYELIITTSILDRNNRYVMRSSDVFNIDSADYWQYRQASQAAEIRLTAPGYAPHAPTPATIPTSL